jgi:hypothetical protein
MIKVRLLSSMASPVCSWAAGDVLDLEPEAAERLVAAGAGEYLHCSSSSTHADEQEIETPEKKIKAKQTKR